MEGKDFFDKVKLATSGAVTSKRDCRVYLMSLLRYIRSLGPGPGKSYDSCTIEVIANDMINSAYMAFVLSRAKF